MSTSAMHTCKVQVGNHSSGSKNRSLMPRPHPDHIHSFVVHTDCIYHLNIYVLSATPIQQTAYQCFILQVYTYNVIHILCTSVCLCQICMCICTCTYIPVDKLPRVSSFNEDSSVQQNIVIQFVGFHPMCCCSCDITCAQAQEWLSSWRGQAKPHPSIQTLESVASL